MWYHHFLFPIFLFPIHHARLVFDNFYDAACLSAQALHGRQCFLLQLQLVLIIGLDLLDSLGRDFHDCALR